MALTELSTGLGGAEQRHCSYTTMNANFLQCHRKRVIITKESNFEVTE